MTMRRALLVVSLTMFCGAITGLATPGLRADARDRDTAQAAASAPVPSAASRLPALGPNLDLTEADCTAAKLGSSVPVAAIGEPVSAVTFAVPTWQAPAGAAPAYCRVDGSMAPVSTGPTARPINFRVLLPASWNHRAAHIGGGGINGVIPNVAGTDGTTGTPLLARGFVTFGSDSGHQAGGPPRGGAPAPAPGAPTMNTRRTGR